MTKANKFRKIFVVYLLAILFLPGFQKDVQAEPLIVGFSICFYPGFGDVQLSSFTSIGSGQFPEVQVIGQISTITVPFAPFIQVFPPAAFPNTSEGSAVLQNFFATALAGVYSIGTLHGYIDEDLTEHESGTSLQVCFL